MWFLMVRLLLHYLVLGYGRVTFILVALLGPLLKAFMVNVTVSPTFGAILLAVCVTCTSAAGLTVMSQLAMLSEGIGSNCNAIHLRIM